MAELTRVALAFIEEWQKLKPEDREIVLHVLDDKRHEFKGSGEALRNAFATAAFLLVELVPSK